MQGQLGIKAGQTQRCACPAATFAKLNPRNGNYLSFEVHTTTNGFKERWWVWDYGFEVRVLAMPIDGPLRWESAAVRLLEHGINRKADYETAKPLALQVMEAAGLLAHTPGSHEHLLPQPDHQPEGTTTT